LYLFWAYFSLSVAIFGTIYEYTLSAAVSTIDCFINTIYVRPSWFSPKENQIVTKESSSWFGSIQRMARMRTSRELFEQGPSHNGIGGQ